jgi:hypothetical protein
MNIIKIQGGIGNQMFQYALCYVLRKQGNKVKIDTHMYNYRKMHNGYMLEKAFGIVESIASKTEINKMIYSKNKIEWFIKRVFIKILKLNIRNYLVETENVNLDIYSKYKDIYFDGYWQSIKYFNSFKREIQELFSFKINDEIVDELQEIKNRNAISLHFRRGDYIKNKLHKEICDNFYYKKALNIIKKNIKNAYYFIFTDDKEWVRDNVVIENSEIVGLNKKYSEYTEMFLMSKCKHNIICNSSFSWWGAFLNKNDDKIIIMPKKWFNGREYNINNLLITEKTFII